MWVNPEVEYVKAKVDGETWYISKECADKLLYQDHKVEIIGKVAGMHFMGKKCFAPFVEREIIILPSVHCDPKISTGIVTSVPSDAPYDWIPLKELQESKALCDKYRISNEEVKAIKLIPIIKSKGYGEFPAVELCKKMGITKSSQTEKLDAATQEIYKAGFHTGTMMDNCGPYSGMPVAKAKDMMRKALLDSKKAAIFYETSRQAKSRDGGEVVVAVLDNQWFLDFNAKGWKDLAYESLKGIELWPEKYRKQFEDVFAWLDKRPCARMRGLGTKLPFDEKWVIESLSDSTIYMALYPIAHLIRKCGAKKEQLNSDFFEYVMNSAVPIEKAAQSTKISKQDLLKMHDEWNYWYPFDQRHTFTAHLSNHLSFMIFAHTACFGKKDWPKRISFHGMVISEGDKMSKSKGNVVTLVEIKEKFGADPFRAFMCNSTSVESTFNWDSGKVQGMKDHLSSLFETIRGMQLSRNDSKGYLKYASFVSRTERLLLAATCAIEKMDLRAYSSVALFDMLSSYKKVRALASSKEDLDSINGYLAGRWTRLLAPLVPHVAEELWSIGKNKGLVSSAPWPKADESLINEKLERIEDVVSTLRLDILRIRELAKIEKVSKVRVFVAPEWKWKALEIVKGACNGRPDFGAAMKALSAEPSLKKYASEIPAFAKGAVSRLGELSNLEKFDEAAVINEVRPVLEKEFGSIEVIRAEDSKEAKAKNAFPGKPALLVE